MLRRGIVGPMQIQCSTCGGVVPDFYVNVERMLARCAECNSVFDIKGQVGGTGARVRQRPKVALPSALRILQDEPESDPGSQPYRIDAARQPQMVLERSWSHPSVLFLMLLSIWLDWFLIKNSSSTFHKGGSWIDIVYILLHLPICVGLTYFTLCGLVNRTRIAVEGGRLVIQHGPLPWPGNRVLGTQDLDQLFCEEKIGRRGSRSYALVARMKDGEKVELLKSLPEADQALYLEQLLENRLGIVDVPVAGEFRG